MSRVAKQPVPLPQGVTATISADSISVKGAKGTLSLALNARLVKVVQDASALKVEKANDGREADMVAGSTRAHLANIVQGVSKGYERKLELVGVGYRAAAPGRLHGARGHHHRNAEPDRNSGQGFGRAETRPGLRRHPRVPSARAVQGQRRPLCRREDRTEGSQEEVIPGSGPSGIGVEPESTGHFSGN